MPFLSDAGAGNYAAVINGAGDRMREQYGQNIQQDQMRQKENRALHPAVQKWLQKVMNGEMTPAEAAAAAHQEIDGSGQPGGMSAPPMVQATEPSRLGGPGEQGQMGGMQGAAGGAPMPATRQPSPYGGGMQGAATERPMNAMDLQDAQRVGSMAAPYARMETQKSIATGNNTSRETIAQTNNEGKNSRQDKAMKYKEKELKQKADQFEAMMAWRYDSLKQDMDKLRASIEARRQMAEDARTEKKNAQTDKQRDELLKKDIDSLNNIDRNIKDLQDAKVRVGTDLEPEQAAQSDKMIAELQREREHLKKSIDFDMRQRGQRQGLRAEPGSYENNDTEGPVLPGVGAALPGRSDSADQLGGPLPPDTLGSRKGGDVGQRQTIAPTLSTKTDVREPKMIKVKNKITGEEGYIDAAEVESFLGDVGEAEFMKRYEITGVK